jgi:Tfp pilus assembly protein PilO
MTLKSREKVLIIFAVIAIAVWVFNHFYFAPQTRKINALKAELKVSHLPKQSDSSQMKVISLTPQEENLPPPEGKKEKSASQYRRVTVQMVLHSSYAKLGNYLKGIEDLPFLINVDNIQIERIEEVRPLLKVSMVLSMYITSS